VLDREQDKESSYTDGDTPDIVAECKFYKLGTVLGVFGSLSVED
jgi:hypothetical protein